MEGPYYLMPSGKLPMQDGKLVLITQAEFEDCCCEEPDAPTVCPCDPWPPESWPCGGLLETYAVSGTVEVLSGDDAGIWDVAGTVVASPENTCQWNDLTATQTRQSDSKVYEVGLRLELGWTLSVIGGVGGNGNKPTGLTPVGSYTGSTSSRETNLEVS